MQFIKKYSNIYYKLMTILFYYSSKNIKNNSKNIK